MFVRAEKPAAVQQTLQESIDETAAQTEEQ